MKMLIYIKEIASKELSGCTAFIPYIFVYHMYTIYQVITYDNSFLLNLHIIFFHIKITHIIKNSMDFMDKPLFHH